MGPFSVYQAEAVETLKQWFESSSGLLVEAYVPHSGGGGDFYIVTSLAQFDGLVSTSQPGSVLFVLREKPFPLRGIVDDQFILAALSLVSEGSWYLIAGPVCFPARVSFLADGNSHAELKGDLDKLRGQEIWLSLEPQMPDQYWLPNFDPLTLVLNVPNRTSYSSRSVLPDMNFDPRIENEISSQPYPLLFATVSGAHLYGFPSPDSDYDLRGVHILPVREVIGLSDGRETIETTKMRDGLEIDLVTHDLKKFFGLLLKKNGYVMEQLFSPLVLRTSPEHEELKAIAKTCLTRHHSHHYFGFAENQWKLFNKENPRRVKPLLYVYRVLLTGIHLMRSGEIESNLVTLNQEFKLPYISELIARKLSGPEKSTLEGSDVEFYQREYLRLKGELEQAYQSSQLPEAPAGKTALNDLLVSIRLATFMD